LPDSTDEPTQQGVSLSSLRSLGAAFLRPDSYGFVLLLVVVTYIVSISVTGATAASIVLTVQLVTVWLALRTAQAARLFRIVADVVLGLAAVVAVGSFFVHGSGAQLGAIFVISCLLYLVAPFAIVRHLLRRQVVDRESLLGAVTAYLLFGMFFAFAYRAIGELGSVPFFGHAGRGTLSQDLFFSFVTIATVGYGNLVPAANPGQVLAVVEAITGQLFLIVAVGKVVSSMTPMRKRPPNS